MEIMLCRNRIKLKPFIIVFVLGSIVFYNEFLIYEIQRLRWISKECPECIRVLLVGDPQILGIKNENYFGASIAIWDSDRYLEKTFSRALRYADPHVITFLGDIMDEGHFASAENFEIYKKRLHSIFKTSEKIMKIYLPGDNDIGGEEDFVSKKLQDRFNFAYSQPDTLHYNSVTFYKINRLLHEMPSTPEDSFLIDYAESNTTNVVLSHMPLLFVPGTFVQNVIKELTPQIIFSAHGHTAMHASYDTATDQLSEIKPLPPQIMQMYQLRLDIGDIHEIQIPTCSYRMGTPHMGYGLAYISTREKTLDFTILWSPGRFRYLCAYIVLGSILSIIFIIMLIRCRRSSSYSTYKRTPMV